MVASQKGEGIPLAPLRERRGEIPRCARNDIGAQCEGGTT